MIRRIAGILAERIEPHIRRQPLSRLLLWLRILDLAMVGLWLWIAGHSAFRLLSGDGGPWHVALGAFLLLLATASLDHAIREYRDDKRRR